jgi:hypothetical protein
VGEEEGRREEKGIEAGVAVLARYILLVHVSMALDTIHLFSFEVEDIPRTL